MKHFVYTENPSPLIFGEDLSVKETAGMENMVIYSHRLSQLEFN